MRQPRTMRHKLDYPSAPSRGVRRFTVRPVVLLLSLFCLAIGVAALVVVRNNFTMPSPDDDLKPTTMAEEDAFKQVWLDYAAPLILFGLLGMVLLPFSIRFKQDASTGLALDVSRSEDSSKSTADEPVHGV